MGLMLTGVSQSSKVVATSAASSLRAGITTVMLPARNRRDLEEIPADAREKLQLVWIERVDDALATALLPASVESAV